MSTVDVASAADETIAAIDGALATYEVPAPLIAILRDLQTDLVSTLGDIERRPDEAAVERIVALRRTVGAEMPAEDLPSTSASGSWLRLACAFTRRGLRALEAEPPCVASAYLREVADLLHCIATIADERARAELTAFAQLT